MGQEESVHHHQTSPGAAARFVGRHLGVAARVGSNPHIQQVPRRAKVSALGVDAVRLPI